MSTEYSKSSRPGQPKRRRDACHGARGMSVPSDLNSAATSVSWDAAMGFSAEARILGDSGGAGAGGSAALPVEGSMPDA